MTAPFILHINTLSNNKVLPIDILEGHKKLPNYSKWEKAVLGKESVRSIFEEKDFVAAYEERMRKRRADASAK